MSARCLLHRRLTATATVTESTESIDPPSATANTGWDAAQLSEFEICP
jgi:hypothetical protein